MRPEARLRLGRVTVWDTARAKGVAPMPMPEQLRLAGYYSDIGLYNENEAARRQEGLRAASILMADRVTPEQRSRLAEDSNGSALLRTYQTGNARRALDFAVAMKIEPKPVNPQMRVQLERYCRGAGVPAPPL